MASKALLLLSTYFAGVQAGPGSKVVDRDLAPKPVPTSAQYFNVINLFSYDQPLALQANGVPGGPENAQDSFIQFYLNDPGNGRNGGCQLTWDPQENEGPPINVTQNLEFDGYKTATLRSYQTPGNFVVDIKHELHMGGATFIREGTLNISTSDPEWVCTKGSCRFSTPRWTTVPYTNRRTVPNLSINPLAVAPALSTGTP